MTSEKSKSETPPIPTIEQQVDVYPASLRQALERLQNRTAASVQPSQEAFKNLQEGINMIAEDCADREMTSDLRQRAGRFVMDAIRLALEVREKAAAAELPEDLPELTGEEHDELLAD